MNTESYVEIESMRIYELSALADAILDKIESIHAKTDSLDDLGVAIGLSCLLSEMLKEETKKAA